MNQPEEILNIDYHRRRLLLKALNKAGNVEDAAKLLGISWRSVYRLKKEYNIVLEKQTSKYIQIDHHE